MKTWCVSVVAVVAGLAGCSMLNREGPDVTCADLQNGVVNACEEGIIATCVAGEVRFEVCSDKEACDGTWQEQGAYRCEEGDAIPTPSATGGSGGGTGGSGGGSVSTCESTGICRLATAQTGKIAPFALDAENVYFGTSCAAIWRVPKAGGAAKNLIPASSDCSQPGQVSVDGSYAYHVRDYRDIERVPLAGGGLEILATDAGTNWVEVDGKYVFWAGSGLVRYDKSTKSHQVISSTVGDEFVADATHLYWTSSNRRNLYRVAKSASVGAQPEQLEAGEAWVNAFAPASGDVYLVDEYGKTLLRIDFDVGSKQVLADGIETSANSGFMQLDGSYAYWYGSSRIFRVSISGGTPEVVVEATLGVGGFRVDSRYVFWTDGDALWRADK